MSKKVQLLFLSRSDLESCLTMRDAIEAVEKAFTAHGNKQVKQPPKTLVDIEEFNGEFAAMPAYVSTIERLGIKYGCGYYENEKKFGLPSIMGVIVLADARNGAPLAIIESSFITGVRTGAAGAVAAKYLAKKDSKEIGIIGAGVQSRFQLIGLNELFDIANVRVFDILEEKSENYAKEMSEKLDVKIEAANCAEEAVKGMDIIATCTPSRTPIVKAEWLTPGMHINAIGSSNPHQIELDPLIMKKVNKIVVDYWEQTKQIGNFKVPLSKGIINEQDIYAEIGEILVGKKSGRTSPNEITLFDSSGLAIQDIAAAAKAYEVAQRKGVGSKFLLLEATRLSESSA